MAKKSSRNKRAKNVDSRTSDRDMGQAPVGTPLPAPASVQAAGAETTARSSGTVAAPAAAVKVSSGESGGEVTTADDMFNIKKPTKPLTIYRPAGCKPVSGGNGSPVLSTSDPGILLLSQALKFTTASVQAERKKKQAVAEALERKNAEAGNTGEGGDDNPPPRVVRSEDQDPNALPSIPSRRLPEHPPSQLRALNSEGLEAQEQNLGEIDRAEYSGNEYNGDYDDDDDYDDARELSERAAIAGLKDALTQEEMEALHHQQFQAQQREAHRLMHLQQQQLIEVAHASASNSHSSRSTTTMLGIGGGGSSDKPTSEETYLRKKLTEMEFSLQQSQSSASNLDHHYRKLWTRANAQSEELKGCQNQVQRLTDELDGVKVQLADAKALSEVRGKELKEAQDLLAKADTHSATDVAQNADEEGAWETSGGSDILSTAAAIQKVDVLNVEIWRVAGVLGKMLQKTGFEERAHRQITLISEKAKALLGENMAALLAAGLLERANFNPLLVQVVLQIGITNWCKMTISSWKPGNSDASNMLAELYSKIREVEDSTFSSRWRSTTWAQLQFSSDGWSKDLLGGLLSILTFSGWSTPNPNQQNLFEEQFLPILNAIIELRKALGEDITSFDLEVAAVDSGTIFNSLFMDNGWPALTKEGASDVVSGTTGLGLQKVVMEPSTRGLIPKADIIYRPRIILERTVKEALIPPSLKPQKKGLLKKGTASRDGRD